MVLAQNQNQRYNDFMLIESNELKRTLISIKEQLIFNVDKARKNKVKDTFLSNIGIIETILIWLSNTEKQGVIDMETLKLSVGKTIKLSDIAAESRSKIDPAIIEEAKALRPGEAVQMNAQSVKWTYFANRVYTLRKEGKLPKEVKPLKRRDSFYLTKED